MEYGFITPTKEGSSATYSIFLVTRGELEVVSGEASDSDKMLMVKGVPSEVLRDLARSIEHKVA